MNSPPAWVQSRIPPMWFLIFSPGCSSNIRLVNILNDARLHCRIHPRSTAAAWLRKDLLAHQIVETRQKDNEQACMIIVQSPTC
jgi:hypothetical protein